MSESGWFSVRLRHVILIEGEGATRYGDSIHVLRARDFEDAFQRALSIGRKQEQEYVGGEGKRVRRRLKEVVSLDAIDAVELDGAEVYAESLDVPPNDRLGFDAEFAPERSRPAQTV